MSYVGTSDTDCQRQETTYWISKWKASVCDVHLKRLNLDDHARDHTLLRVGSCPPPNELCPDSFPPDSLASHTIDLFGGKDQQKPYTVTLCKHLFHQYSLFGRRATVYRAASTSVDPGGRVLAVKLSQHVCTRTSETELTQRAHDRGAVEHLQEIVKAKDLWYLSDGIRKQFILDESQKWKDRVLRCIVVPFYLPLHEQLRENPDSIKTMVKQMLTCENIKPVVVVHCVLTLLFL